MATDRMAADRWRDAARREAVAPDVVRSGSPARSRRGRRRLRDRTGTVDRRRAGAGRVIDGSGWDHAGAADALPQSARDRTAPAAGPTMRDAAAPRGMAPTDWVRQR